MTKTNLYYVNSWIKDGTTTFIKDFGNGKYLTTSIEKAKLEHKIFKDSIIEIYQINNIEELNCRFFNTYSKEWLEFVLQCKLGVQHNYDIVAGPMADDTIHDLVEAYEAKVLRLDAVIDEYKHKDNMYHQVAICSDKALDRLIKTSKEYEICDRCKKTKLKNEMCMNIKKPGGPFFYICEECKRKNN